MNNLNNGEDLIKAVDKVIADFVKVWAIERLGVVIPTIIKHGYIEEEKQPEIEMCFKTRDGRRTLYSILEFNIYNPPHNETIKGVFTPLTYLKAFYTVMLESFIKGLNDINHEYVRNNESVNSFTSEFLKSLQDNIQKNSPFVSDSNKQKTLDDHYEEGYEYGVLRFYKLFRETCWTNLETITQSTTPIDVESLTALFLKEYNKVVKAVGGV